MPRKRKRKDIPERIRPQKRRPMLQEADLPEVDENEETAEVDWREIGSACSQRRNGRPLSFWMETREDEDES